MRVMVWVLVVACLGMAGPVRAGEDEDRVVGGILSGLLGQPQNQDATYVAEQRERLLQALSSGEYATSRQGEPIDEWVLGIPLTHKDHVYRAQPAKPSQVYTPQKR